MYALLTIEIVGFVVLSLPVLVFPGFDTAVPSDPFPPRPSAQDLTGTIARRSREVFGRPVR